MNLFQTSQTKSNIIYQNPCLQCGACCAYYKVTFYWRERSDESNNGVPVSLCEDLNSFKCVMKDTNQTNPRCRALIGTVGKHVLCSIYMRRPKVCREIEPSYKYGLPETKCDKARIAYGLPPLTPEDWKHFNNPDETSPTQAPPQAA